MTASALRTDPAGHEQTAEEVRAWIRDHAAPGVAVVVLHAQRNLHEYHLDEIERVEPRRRRLYLVQHGEFDLFGMARAVPRGVVLRLLKPLIPLLAAAGEGLIWSDGRPISRCPLTPFEQGIAGRIARLPD